VVAKYRKAWRRAVTNDLANEFASVTIVRRKDRNAEYCDKYALARNDVSRPNAFARLESLTPL